MTEGFAAANAWTAATELLRAEGRLSNPQNAFIRLVQPLATVDDKFIIGVGSEFIKDWILEHVAPIMVPQLTAILGRNVHLVITIDPALSEQAEISGQFGHVSTNPGTTNSHQGAVETQHSLHESFHEEAKSLTVQATVPQGADSYFSTEQNNQLNREHPWKSEENIFSTTEGNFSSHENNFSTQEHNFSAQNSSFSEQTTSFNSVLEDSFDTATHFSQSAQDPYSSHSVATHHSSQSATNRYNPQSFTNIVDKSGLNPRYTFDNFVIGDSNRFAHATALAVSDDPGKIYNPLFLYSDSGMGKTHLLHAIGNSVRMTNPEKRVRYTSSEEFMNAFINAIRDKHQREFKDEFRNVDVLLIDDIQFLAQAENTVEEFFHTFNVLSTADKQIVITSDVAPHLLHGFNDRMISRFASGITASIDVPSLETRIAILEKKSLAEQMTVPRAVLEYIASKMTSSVRDIEGALRRVAAYGDLSGEDVTVELADFVLKDIFNDPSSIQITAGIIMAQTANYFDISVEDLKSPTRTRSLTVPRHIAMYLCREMTDLSLPKIAEVFDRRDHTTVLNALKNIEQHMTTDQRLYNHLSELTTRIKQSAKQQGQK